MIGRRVRAFQSSSELAVPRTAGFTATERATSTVSQEGKVVPGQVKMAITAKAAFAERVFKKLPHLPYAVADAMKTRNALKGKSMEVPAIRPAKTKEYKCKQSRYPHVPELPMRAIAFGPSGAGKSVLLQQLILEV